MNLKSILKTFGRRQFSSALYITGDKASETCAVLTPFLDLDKRFSEIDQLKQNINHRKIDIDPFKLKNLWDSFKKLKAVKFQLEERRVDIAKRIKNLNKNLDTSKVQDEVEKLKMEGRFVKEDLKSLMKAYWDIEEQVMLKGLKLPNYLHEDTPINENKIILQLLNKPDLQQPYSSIEIGTKLNLLDYRDNSCVYYLNQAADLEIGLSNYFLDQLKLSNFIQFSNPDTARSVIMEGCAVDHTNPEHSLIIHEDNANINIREHLVGGASLYPFVAYYTKQKIQSSSFPIKLVSVGRRYQPNQEMENSLLNLYQGTACEVFVLSEDNKVMHEFHDVLSIITETYKKLNIHFQVVYTKAEDLHPWQSLQASIQMYSCFLKKYVEVGNVCLSGRYICERLLISSTNKNKEDFASVVSGMAMNFPVIFGCLLEESDELKVPNCLESYLFGF